MQRFTSVDDVFELLESGGGEAYLASLSLCSNTLCKPHGAFRAEAAKAL